MANLQSFVYYASGVINYDEKLKDDESKSILIQHLMQFVDNYNRIGNYYFIVHDDTDILHIHFAFVLSSQTRLETIFNKLADVIVYKYKDTRDTFGINIEKCSNLNAYLRYMLHIDEASIKQNKKKFDIENIITNDSVNSIEGIINSKKGNIDAYYLRNAVLDSSSDFDLMVKLGLQVYHKYRYEIDLLKQQRISLLLEREKEKERDLPF